MRHIPLPVLDDGGEGHACGMWKVARESSTGEIEIPRRVRCHGVDAGRAEHASEIGGVKDGRPVVGQLHDKSAAVRARLGLEALYQRKIVGRCRACDIDVSRLGRARWRFPGRRLCRLEGVGEKNFPVGSSLETKTSVNRQTKRVGREHWRDIADKGGYEPPRVRLPTTYVLPAESAVIAEIRYGYASPGEVVRSPAIAKCCYERRGRTACAHLIAVSIWQAIEPHASAGLFHARANSNLTSLPELHMGRAISRRPASSRLVVLKNKSRPQRAASG